MQACLTSTMTFWRGVFVSFDIRQELVDQIGNPVLSLLHQAVMLFCVDMVPTEHIGRSELDSSLYFQLRNTSDYLEALIANDIDAAIDVVRQNRNFLTKQTSVWQRSEREIALSQARKYDFGPEAEKWTGRRTLADKVARQLLRDIRLRGWRDGMSLGTEASLLQSYGVSRATFRQAVRLLEHYRAAKMLRGPKGGLVVTALDPDVVVEATVSYLKRLGVRLDHVRPFQIELQMVAIELLCTQPSAQALAELRQCYTQLQSMQGAQLRRKLGEFLHLVVAQTQNRVLEVYWRILAALAHSGDIPAALPGRRILAVATPAFCAALQGVAQCDPVRARRAMFDYLTAETDWLDVG
jgi:DNA-binding FadR family transcriptional regulator